MVTLTDEKAPTVSKPSHLPFLHSSGHYEAVEVVQLPWHCDMQPKETAITGTETKRILNVCIWHILKQTELELGVSRQASVFNTEH